MFLTNAASASVSADGLWHDVADEASLSPEAGARLLIPTKYRLLALDVAAFRELVRNAPLELTHGADEAAPVMPLPMPDGTFKRFRVQESPIMDVRLAARLPEVKTYRAQGIDDPAAWARLDFTPAGFHGFIRSSAGTVFIDPYARGDIDHYVSYWRHDYKRDATAAPFQCGFAPVDPPPSAVQSNSVVSESRGLTSLVASGATLRTYRLALAGTGEYTTFYGGTVAGAQAGMVTTMNRVNGIFENDVAVRMTMVDNTAIVFTDPDTDPYDNTSGDMNNNQATIDDLIGTDNYDIGHLFGTGGGGVVLFLGLVCDPDFKASGLTGSSSPVNDAYDVDYVAHEIGHQFGGDHTFNGTTSSCGGGNRSSSAAYEPGSGSTIMGYAGICGSENLQPNSDPYFHVKSIDEMVAFTTSVDGACAVATSTGNNAPTVNAGAAITIPKSTPFYLTGSATDPDDDPLTFCWEQFDLGTSSNGSTINTDNGFRPLFRSFNPVTSPVRTFPKVSNLLNNTTTIGEVLPTTSRTMHFRLTARDNQPGGGGVNSNSTTVTVTSAAGPFLVTAPNTAVTWAGNSSQTVTWNVANTTAAPVACADVKVLLSTDGGNTFPTTLHASTPNDGTQATTIPNIATTTARIRVECVTSPFFDLSNANFTITLTTELVTNVIATATSTTNVDVTWNSVAGAVSYEIHRKAPGGSFTLVGTSGITSFSDNTAAAGTSYLYAVKWIDGSAIASALSTPDLATTILFTDPTLTAQSTSIKADHFTELRTATNAVRSLAGLSAFSFTDPTLTAGITSIKTVHLTELRTALDAARTSLALSALTYTDPTPVAQITTLKAAHVKELRNGMK
jgi:Metallo-peptidase family M12B Reprolysin-like